MHQETSRTVKQIEIMGNRMKVTTKQFVKGNLISKKLANTFRGFRMELLSVMFFGMQLQRIFQSLTSTSMDWMGVNDVMSAFLGTVFLPIAETFLNVVLAIWDAFDALPQPVKDLINILVLVMGVVAPFIVAFASIGLLVSQLGLAFPALAAVIAPIAVAFGPVILVIGAIIAIIAVLSYVWTNNLGDIQGKTAWFVGQIQGAISGFINWVTGAWTSLTGWLQDRWAGGWTGIWNDLIIMWNNIVNWMGGIGSRIVQSLIDGIKSMATNLANAFWNILPDWVKNGLTWIGGGLGAIGNSLRGLFELAQGGIVTGPTPALIGEKGPEAVIPLDRIGSIGGINVTINTGTVSAGSVDSLAREIAEKFSFELSRVRY